MDEEMNPPLEPFATVALTPRIIQLGNGDAVVLAHVACWYWWPAVGDPFMGRERYALRIVMAGGTPFTVRPGSRPDPKTVEAMLVQALGPAATKPEGT